ncbi:MAG: hypothetical protein ABI851_05430 [Saprospiraceae bacterium]
MSNTVVPIKKDETKESKAENLKGIENHKKAAIHLEAAAKLHNEAAKHHEAGNHDMAALNTVKAHGQHLLANEAQKEDVKHHALNG